MNKNPFNFLDWFIILLASSLIIFIGFILLKNPLRTPPLSEEKFSYECGGCGPQGTHNAEGRTCAKGLVCKEGLTTSAFYCVKPEESVAKCEGVATEFSIVNWKAFRNEKYGFEFLYPSDLLGLKVDNKEIIRLRHSIDYEHLDPCDFKGGAPLLKQVEDFSVDIELWPQSFHKTIEERDSFLTPYLQNNSLKIEPGGFIEKAKIGNLEGYRIYSGIEGCGEFEYYFPISSDKTLVVTRHWVTELSRSGMNDQELENRPGVITSVEEDILFYQILSTFRFVNQPEDELYLSQTIILSGRKSFEFGEPEIIKAKVIKAAYGPPFDPEMYELTTDEPGQNLYAMSRIVDLNNYIGQTVTINYRDIKGIIIAEEQLVIVDSVSE